MTTPLTLDRLLVPVDFSPAGAEALAYARALATRAGAELELLHVVDAAAVDGVLGPADPAVWSGALQAARRRVDGLRRPDELATVLEGRPADVIADHALARRSDLIVVGSHGRSGLERLLIGSVAEQVVRTAPCPVLVVRRGTTVRR